MKTIKEIQFKSLTDHGNIDLIPYLKKYIEEHPTDKVYIGTDSQNQKDKSIFGIVVVFHKNNKGGHVLYGKLILPKFKEKLERLWKEVELSLELAKYMMDQEVCIPDEIHVDLNPDPKYNSNKILTQAVGWIEAEGFDVKYKPDASVASYAADVICR